jgi:hypothetical protein
MHSGGTRSNVLLVSLGLFHIWKLDKCGEHFPYAVSVLTLGEINLTPAQQELSTWRWFSATACFSSEISDSRDVPANVIEPSHTCTQVST